MARGIAYNLALPRAGLLKGGNAPLWSTLAHRILRQTPSSVSTADPNLQEYQGPEQLPRTNLVKTVTPFGQAANLRSHGADVKAVGFGACARDTYLYSSLTIAG